MQGIFSKFFINNKVPWSYGVVGDYFQLLDKAILGQFMSILNISQFILLSLPHTIILSATFMPYFLFASFNIRLCTNALLQVE